MHFLLLKWKEVACCIKRKAWRHSFQKMEKLENFLFSGSKYRLKICTPLSRTFFNNSPGAPMQGCQVLLLQIKLYQPEWSLLIKRLTLLHSIFNAKIVFTCLFGLHQFPLILLIFIQSIQYLFLNFALYHKKTIVL